MTTLVSFLLVASALVFVGWPFLVAGSKSENSDAEALPPLERQKLDAYAAIKEAEFDRRMGKLSDLDFKALTDKYREQARAAIGAIEDARRSRREGKGAQPARTPKFCPACGQRIGGSAKFCGGCGRSLRAAAA